MCETRFPVNAKPSKTMRLGHEQNRNGPRKITRTFWSQIARKFRLERHPNRTQLKKILRVFPSYLCAAGHSASRKTMTIGRSADFRRENSKMRSRYCRVTVIGFREVETISR